MADKLYKFAVDAPATVNKAKSYLLPLDKSMGKSFRINRLFIQIPDLDAIAAADNIAVQLSLLSQDEAAALYEIISEHEIMTEVIDFHLAEAAITSLIDLNLGCVELKNFRGVFLDTSVKNYLTHLIIGQDGAIDCNFKIEGGYTNADKTDWNYNTF